MLYLSRHKRQRKPDHAARRCCGGVAARGARADLGQGAKEDAGTFGIIDRHFRSLPATPPVWTQHRAQPTPKVITTEPMLGTFIANMAAAKRTRYGRRAWPGGKDDWSKVVDLLLKVTYAKAFRHRQTLSAAAPQRGNTALRLYFHGN